MEERDKYLTEAMGKCWHEYECIDFEYICKCGDISNSYYAVNPKYTSWDAFGKLYSWSVKQDWWMIFLFEWTDDIMPTDIPYKLINPDIFANTVYEFLRDKETSSENSNISG